jgi:hypothetical protein
VRHWAEKTLTSSGEYRTLIWSMATVERFSELIGTVIKTCGLLEWHISFFIRALSTDPILANHILKLPLGRKIQVLRDLMLAQPDLTAPEVKSLCNELEKIAEDRNVIAHSPIHISAEPGGPKIVSRDDSKEFREADLEAFHKRTMDALGKFVGMIAKTTS